MGKFPKPVPLPSYVDHERKERHIQLVRSSQIGITLRSALIIFELIGVVWFQSTALFMDAVSSLMDVLASLFLIFCIKLAKRPPDDDHPFGHGRYEPLGGFLLGVMLTTIGAVLLFQQLLETSYESGVHSMHPWAWIFPFIAVIILEASYRILMRTAKRVNSPALAADAVHYRIDGITSLCAMFALMGAAYYPHHGGLFDHIGAILIACFMIGIGFYATRDNFHQLMDKTPDANYFNLVQEVARKVKGVKGTEKIRIQLYGPDAHIDIDVEVEPDLSVRLAHQISQQVRAAIQKAWPAVRDVTVHIEPYYANDH